MDLLKSNDTQLRGNILPDVNVIIVLIFDSQIELIWRMSVIRSKMNLWQFEALLQHVTHYIQLKQIPSFQSHFVRHLFEFCLIQEMG